MLQGATADSVLCIACEWWAAVLGQQSALNSRVLAEKRWTCHFRITIISKAAATADTAAHPCAESTRTCEAMLKRQEAPARGHLQRRVRPWPQPLKPAALPEAARPQPS